MIIKRLCIVLFFIILAVFPLSAANVSFLVMEVGQKGRQVYTQYPVMWEDDLLDVFFESGHIVSNSPMLQLNNQPQDTFPNEAERDFENAQRGGMGYFMVAIVDYGLSDVTMRLFSTKSRELLKEHKYNVKSFRNTKEEHASIKSAVREMTDFLH